ncbi:MAG: hypothetical protein AAGL23_17555 [Pseudomonadota bacterium]
MKPVGRAAGTFRAIINAVHWTSPYRWFDEILKRNQMGARKGNQESERELFWLDRRYVFSDVYIVGWLGFSVALYLAHPMLPGWIAVPIALRCLGILNKELGVVLFGICKVTDGTDVSASGRVTTLALVNYLTALFCFASLHALLGTVGHLHFDEGAIPIAPLLQAMQVHFALSPAFPPMDRMGHIVVAGQSVFVFFFATLIISLFVSLLNLRSREDRG